MAVVKRATATLKVVSCDTRFEFPVYGLSGGIFQKSQFVSERDRKWIAPFMRRTDEREIMERRRHAGTGIGGI